MKSPTRAIAATINWIAAIGGVAGLLALLIPDVPGWMARHGVAGWATAAAVLVIAPLLTLLDVRSRRIGERAEAERRQAEKDLALVRELLDGWTIEGKFFEYLVEEADHNHFSSSINREIDRNYTRWSRDSREIKTPELARLFESVKNSNAAYRNELGEYMWYKDGGPGTQPNFDLLRVPVEWEENRKEGAYKALGAARTKLIQSLRDLYAAMHDAA